MNMNYDPISLLQRVQLAYKLNSLSPIYYTEDSLSIHFSINISVVSRNFDLYTTETSQLNVWNNFKITITYL